MSIRFRSSFLPLMTLAALSAFAEPAVTAKAPAAQAAPAKPAAAAPSAPAAKAANYLFWVKRKFNFLKTVRQTRFDIHTENII